MAYRKTKLLRYCSVVCKRLYSVLSFQMRVNGSEFRLIQLPCFLLTVQFNSLHLWTGRNSSQLSTPQVSLHWPRTTNSQWSECTEHIITVSREFSCNTCTEFVVGLKVLLHYSINVSTDANVTLASGCAWFFATSAAFRSEKHSFEQFSETVQNTDWYLIWKCAGKMTHLKVRFPRITSAVSCDDNQG